MSNATIETVVQAASAAVSGPNTPEAVKVSHAEERLTLVVRNLAGPALSGMVSAAVVLLAWGGAWRVWTPATEAIRAHYVGGVAIALALMLGVLVWRLDGSKLGRLEVKMGPGSISLGNDQTD